MQRYPPPYAGQDYGGAYPPGYGAYGQAQGYGAYSPQSAPGPAPPGYGYAPPADYMGYPGGGPANVPDYGEGNSFTTETSPGPYGYQYPGNMPEGDPRYLRADRPSMSDSTSVSPVMPSYSRRATYSSTGTTFGGSEPSTTRDRSSGGRRDQGQIQPEVIATSGRSSRKLICILLFGGAMFLGLVVFAIALMLYLQTGQLPIMERTVPNATTATTSLYIRPRDPKLYCTIGPSLKMDEDFPQQVPCNYVIYMELILIDGDQPYSLFGSESWEIFKKAVKKMGTFTAGVSFSLAEGNQEGGLMKPIDKTKRRQAFEQITNMGIYAFGVFDFDVRAFDADDVRKLFEDFGTALPNTGDTSRFLGTVIPTTSIAEKFVKTIPNVVPATTIIIQTHITLNEDTYYGLTDCHTYPMTAVTKGNLFNNSVPTLKVAEGAVDGLRREGDLFDVVFTSSMGVMVYRSKGQPGLKSFKEPCGSAVMGNYDITCENETVLTKTFIDDEMTSFGVANGGEYLITYEDKQSLEAKLQKYVPVISNGWCLYEIDRDVYWNCETGQVKPLQRVSYVAEVLKAIPRPS